MSKEVDSLVLIGHSIVMVNDVAPIHYDDIRDELRGVKPGETSPTIRNFQAGEAFLKLGYLATGVFRGTLTGEQNTPNSFITSTVGKLLSMAPYEYPETMQYPIHPDWEWIDYNKEGLPDMFTQAMKQDPTIIEELRDKWRCAMAVYHHRGTTTVTVEDGDAFLKKVGEESNTLNFEVPPAQDVKTEQWPYYASFSTTTDMWEYWHAALDDLHEVAKEIA